MTNILLFSREIILSDTIESVHMSVCVSSIFDIAAVPAAAGWGCVRTWCTTACCCSRNDTMAILRLCHFAARIHAYSTVPLAGSHRVGGGSQATLSNGRDPNAAASHDIRPRITLSPSDRNPQ